MKLFKYILTVALLLLAGYIIYHEYKVYYPINRTTDSLIINLLKVRDSLVYVNKTIDNKIRIVNKNYEENVNRVINLPYDSDIIFIKNYLSRYYIDSTGLQEIGSDSCRTR